MSTADLPHTVFCFFPIRRRRRRKNSSTSQSDEFVVRGETHIIIVQSAAYNEERSASTRNGSSQSRAMLLRHRRKRCEAVVPIDVMQTQGVRTRGNARTNAQHKMLSLLTVVVWECRKPSHRCRNRIDPVWTRHDVETSSSPAICVGEEQLDSLVRSRRWTTTKTRSSTSIPCRVHA